MSKPILCIALLFASNAVMGAWAEWPHLDRDVTGMFFLPDIAIDPVTQRPVVASFGTVQVGSDDPLPIKFSWVDEYNVWQSVTCKQIPSRQDPNSNEEQYAKRLTLSFTPDNRPCIAFAEAVCWDPKLQDQWNYRVGYFERKTDGTWGDPLGSDIEWPLDSSYGVGLGYPLQQHYDCIRDMMNDLFNWDDVRSLAIGFINSQPYVALGNAWCHDPNNPYLISCPCEDKWAIEVWRRINSDFWYGSTLSLGVGPADGIRVATDDTFGGTSFMASTPGGVTLWQWNGTIWAGHQMLNAVDGHALAVDPITHTPHILFESSLNSYWNIAEWTGSTFTAEVTNVSTDGNGRADLSITNTHVPTLNDNAPILVVSLLSGPYRAYLKTSSTQWTQICEDVFDEPEANYPDVVLDPVSQMPLILDRMRMYIAEPPQLCIRVWGDGRYLTTADGLTIYALLEGTTGDPYDADFDLSRPGTDPGVTEEHFISLLPPNVSGQDYHMYVAADDFEDRMVAVGQSLTRTSCMNPILVQLTPKSGCGTAAATDKPIAWAQLVIPLMVAVGILLSRSVILKCVRKDSAA